MVGQELSDHQEFLRFQWKENEHKRKIYSKE